MKTHERMPELLAPAGSREKLVTAIHYGADAVYLGGANWSLRAKAGNFDRAGLRDAVTYAHQHGVKVYVTVNIFAHNRDLNGLESYLLFLRDAGADALIVADPGILLLCKETVPDMPLHLSTQANVTNKASVRFWQAQGVSRINLARELGLEELRTIRQAAPGIGLEVFVHGALCISYSGRCLLSSYMTGRNANQGDCAHPCRYSYSLLEEKRPGQYFPVEEDERGTYIFNSRDLCLLFRLPELAAAGIDSVKIEGRMKSVGYVGAAVRLYRAALDYVKERREAGAAWEEIVLPPAFADEIAKVGTRGQTENFFSSAPSSLAMLYDRMREIQPCTPVGIVRGSNPLLLETRNVLEAGDQLEYLGRRLEPETCTVRAMSAADGVPLQRANPGSLILLTVDPPLADGAEVNALFRKQHDRQAE
ncbi:peptidase U32 family protein [Candidatus Electronema sp. TJ]|uniref:peptidase U32 family protein n=1 Tax=Candidatus Electronema sp. TJ TaxID=3401573 RepID=UPI003AA80778